MMSGLHAGECGKNSEADEKNDEILQRANCMLKRVDETCIA